MDRKFNDHVWCKVNMTIIKYDFYWVSKVANAWATCDVKVTFVSSLFDLVFKMKLLGMAT
jgi:hypothetical protein